MFRKKYPLAWTYHRNSSRWPHNVLTLDEDRHETPAFKELPDAPLLSLPAPRALELPLGEAIQRRFSCRRFTSEPAALADLASILYWGYGKLAVGSFNESEMVYRPVPSGGGLYPLEIYPIVSRVAGLDAGIFHYNVLSHGLERLHEGAPPTTFLSELFMSQPYAARAAFVVVITAMVDRTMWKYEDRGYRYLLIEAGHVAQNINLSATAWGLATVNLGGFFDLDLSDLLQLDPEVEIPLYGVAVGRPAAGEVELLRLPEEPLDGA